MVQEPVMSSPQMRKWIYHRAKQMLDDLNEIPYSDDVDDKKLAIIRKGLREASIELFKKAAERTAAELMDSKELKELNSTVGQIRKIDID